MAPLPSFLVADGNGPCTRGTIMPTTTDDEITQRWTRPDGSRIVIVIDDRERREEIAARLRHEGYVVHGALSGVELLRVLEAVVPRKLLFDGIDLFIVDPHFTGATGLEVLRRLRSATRDTPILALPDDTILADAARLRIEVLALPVKLDHLVDAVLLTLLSRRAAVAERGGA